MLVTTKSAGLSVGSTKPATEKLIELSVSTNCVEGKPSGEKHFTVLFGGRSLSSMDESCKDFDAD